MNTEQDARDRRWIAHYLGEDDPKDRVRTEAELRASQETASQYRRLIEGVEAWAHEPVPYTPLKMEEGDLEGARLGGKSNEGSLRSRIIRFFAPARWTWGLAAAALLVFAVMQLDFTLKLGRAELAWGESAGSAAIGPLGRNVVLLQEKIQDLELASEVNRAQIREIAFHNLVLQETLRASTAELAFYQQTETRRRYHDIENLMRMARYEYPIGLEWLDPADAKAPQTIPVRGFEPAFDDFVVDPRPRN